MADFNIHGTVDGSNRKLWMSAYLERHTGNVCISNEVKRNRKPSFLQKVILNVCCRLWSYILESDPDNHDFVSMRTQADITTRFHVQIHTHIQSLVTVWLLLLVTNKCTTSLALHRLTFNVCVG